MEHLDRLHCCSTACWARRYLMPRCLICCSLGYADMVLDGFYDPVGNFRGLQSDPAGPSEFPSMEALRTHRCKEGELHEASRHVNPTKPHSIALLALPRQRYRENLCLRSRVVDRRSTNAESCDQPSVDSDLDALDGKDSVLIGRR